MAGGLVQGFKAGYSLSLLPILVVRVAKRHDESLKYRNANNELRCPSVYRPCLQIWTTTRPDININS